MSTSRVREEGFSKDADKLVRRLSLVALLLSRQGHPVSADEIRRRVEGYPTMTEDAFKRRFYEDRSELAGLGVEIATEPGAGAGPELYSLAANAYYLPQVELSGEELTALAACLAVLEDRFAYSQPLRLALLSLAQGRPELITDAGVPPLTVVPETAAPAAILPKLQAAIADRKTVRFTYYAISRDQELARTVDPYGLQLVAGEWYLIGWCHLREAERTFRLSRIRSRVTHATRAPHDFATPDTFDIGAYRDRPAWRLARPAGTARIRVAPEMAWWVEAHWTHCGTIEVQQDGSLIYETAYADARPLMGWVLGLADAAELLEPVELREQLAAQLRGLDALLETPPLEASPTHAGSRPTAAGAPRPRRASGDWRVEVDRFTRLTALTTYLLRSCANDEALLDVAAIRAALGASAEELRADVRLLNLVNFGADGALLYAEYEGRGKLRVYCDLAGPAFARPARLSPLQADTVLLAVELVGGQLPTASGTALASAAQKLRAARRDRSPTLQSGDLLQPADDVLDAVNAAIGERWLLDIDYWAEGTERTSRRTVEPYLLVHSRGEWYYVCWCRTAGGTRVFRAATTKTARLLDEHFEPRSDVELELYRREGIPASGSYAPRTATIWYSPSVRRWIAERQTIRPLADGSCLAEQPYVDERWLSHHLLRFAGQARPVAPPEAVADLRATLRRLLDVYAR
jgi:predicted DNA-binding transcriptional regulator YafY